jgi:hypothetical protein
VLALLLDEQTERFEQDVAESQDARTQGVIDSERLFKHIAAIYLHKNNKYNP